MGSSRVSALGAAACMAGSLFLAHCGDPAAAAGDVWYPGGDDGGGIAADGGESGGRAVDGGPGKVGGHAGEAGGAGGDHDVGAVEPDGGAESDGGEGIPACAHPGSEDPGPYPQTDFNPQPPYIPSDTLVLTLDDGPDSTVTAQVLDLLKARHTKATFFINTENWGGPLSLVQRMIDEGHELANHTVHHHHLGAGGGSDGIAHETTAAGIESEIAGVETAVDTLTHGALPRLTLFRAPFGEPYQSGDAADQALVFPVVARHGVAINWNFDTQDTTTSDASVVFGNFKNLVKTPGAPGAAWGIFLMHTVHPQDVAALPMMLDYIEQNHFKLARVEDVLCWKFGKRSKELVR